MNWLHMPKISRCEPTIAMTDLDYKFDFIASTGRTATTYLASALDSFDGVASCHEGYLNSNKLIDPALELVNLENNLAYKSSSHAFDVVEKKRNANGLSAIQNELGVSRIIDVAYYNSTICVPLLSIHRASRMLGIVRGCESFVRSATTLVDEDPLPVGWPDPEKPLTQREKFVEMGRIRPRPNTKEKSDWAGFSAIQRNIWLWRETNVLLYEAKKMFPDRVLIGRFETFQSDQNRFWELLLSFFELPSMEMKIDNGRSEKINKKPFGYQIGPSSSWSAIERQYLNESQQKINELIDYEF